jgi:hypothetical protein
LIKSDYFIMWVVNTPEQLTQLISSERHVGGVVMLATLPGCPSCFFANNQWPKLVETWFLRRQLARELDLGGLQLVRAETPSFATVLAPLAIAYTWHSPDSTQISRGAGQNRTSPPVVYLGKNNFHRVSSIETFEHDITLLLENNLGHALTAASFLSKCRLANWFVPSPQNANTQGHHNSLFKKLVRKPRSLRTLMDE